MPAFLFLLSLLVTFGRAQQLLWTLTPEFAQPANLGDTDGDGYDDWIATAWITPGSTLSDYEIRVYSGRDGSVLRRGTYYHYPYYPGNPTIAGDMNGDGRADYALLGAPRSCGCKQLTVHDGSDDRVLWTVQRPAQTTFAYNMVGDLDLNGDGRPDLVTADPFDRNVTSTGFGSITAFDHRGNLLYHRVGAAWDYLGASLARLGDVDGDGCDDFVMGLGDPFFRGGVEVVSGRTGTAIRRVFGAQVGDYIGIGVTGCGDLDGDGVEDFASGGGLSSSRGSVQAFSTRTGQLLFAYYSGHWNDRFGSNLAAADVDQDGVLDILVPHYLGFTVLSGRERGWLWDFPPIRASFYVSVFETPEQFPRLYTVDSFVGWTLSCAPPGTRYLGPGCAGSLGAEPRMGLRDLGGGRRITLSGAGPGVGALLVLGGDTGRNAPVDLSPWGFTPGCLLYPQPQALGFFVTGTSGLDMGYAHHDFRFDDRPWPMGIEIGAQAQWLVLDAAGRPGGVSAALGLSLVR